MQDPKLSLAVDDVNAALFRVPLTEPGPLLSLAIAAGPGGPEQQQLYSLLSSLLKLSALVSSSTSVALAYSLSFSWWNIVCAAIKLVQVAQNSSSRSSSSSSSSSSSTATHQSTDAPEAAAGSSTAPSIAPAVTLLPSLVLVGRCCLLWAQHLQQAVPQLLQVHPGMGAVPPQQAFEHRLFTPSAGAVVAHHCGTVSDCASSASKKVQEAQRPQPCSK